MVNRTVRWQSTIGDDRHIQHGWDMENEGKVQQREQLANREMIRHGGDNAISGRHSGEQVMFGRIKSIAYHGAFGEDGKTRKRDGGSAMVRHGNGRTL